MLSREKLKSTLFLLLLAFLVSCSGTIMQPLSPLVTSDSDFLSPVSPVLTPSVAAIDLPSPEPQSGLGSVVGQLVTYDISGENQVPYIADLYLARIISASEPGYAPLIAFSENTDPQAIQDPASGKFLFLDIAPGDYALVIWSPVANTIVEDAKTGESVILEIVANQVTDLGEIIIP